MQLGEKSMLKKLTAKEIERDWKLIYASVGDNLEPIIRAKSGDVLQAMKDDFLQVFAILDENEDEPLRGYAVTLISNDYLGSTKSLIVLRAVAVLPVNSDIWSDSLFEIINFAKKIGATRLMGLTESDGVAAFVGQLKGEAKYKLLTLEV